MAMSNKPLPGQRVPQCDKNGNYNAQQCSGSVGSCWCVDIVTGQEIEYLHVDKDGLPLCGKKYIELFSVELGFAIRGPLQLKRALAWSWRGHSKL